AASVFKHHVLSMFIRHIVDFFTPVFCTGKIRGVIPQKTATLSSTTIHKFSNHIAVLVIQKKVFF
ncbi:hypothetical protein, partial [Salmonella enterica]|uniref:hypothetical protein n=1 Tax=Salmonella enterica TaxID=28901 RepID=UPI001C993D07